MVKNKAKIIKTRIAPSPTGFMHIGNLRTALYNYLFAKQNEGEFLLRIEDTDRERFVKGAKQKTLEILEWAGLKWSGRPIVQSRRLKIYQQAAQKLIKNDRAYYCFCPPARLEKMRQKQIEEKLPPKYDGRCRDLTEEEIKKKLKNKESHVIRYKVPENEMVEFEDLVYGRIKINSNEIDDQVLLKSDGYPTYHLAVVIDDYKTGITHVMRGEDWLPSTPKHILLYKAFGWPVPVFCHLPNILGENKKKLSKRAGDVSVENFKKQGYLPAALLNYLALLGWNPGTEQEIFSLPELIKQFNIKKIHKAGAVFDIKKLDSINGCYIRKLKSEQLAKLCLPYLKERYKEKLKKYNIKYVKKVIGVEQERLKKLSEVVYLTEFFFSDTLEYDGKLLLWKKCPDKEKTRENLENARGLLTKIKRWNRREIEAEIKKYIQKNNLSNGEVFWPLRMAVSGRQASPGPVEIIEILGKEESIARIELAIKKLS